MELKLIQIGNSQGIRLPKAVLDEVGPFAVADLQVKDGALVITPKRAPRQGWEEEFKGFGQAAEEKELLADLEQVAPEEDWTW